MKAISAYLLVLLIGFTSVFGKVYFEERFLKGNIDRWTQSEKETDKLGKADYALLEPVRDAVEDGGLNTSEPNKFYRLSSPLKETLKNKGKTICIQYTAKYPDLADCGGAYIKLMGEDFKPSELDGDSPYEIMFGPDSCGYINRRIHVIFSHKGDNHLVKENIEFSMDNNTHLYQLNVFPNNTFAVYVDQTLRRNGSLVDDFDMLPPRTIDDPTDKKPSDWVDESTMPDPNDKKPDDWDKPETIVDEKAVKPDDWDDESDGEWKAPMIRNPEYKGEWKPKLIANPDYKGPWSPKQIPNPDFKDDPSLYERTIKYVAVDIWQVHSGVIFDNFFISDDLEECEENTKYWTKRSAFEETLTFKPDFGSKTQFSSNFDELRKQAEAEQEKEEEKDKKHEEL